MKFKNEVVIVTSATRGIGKAIALAFAKQEADVILIGRSQEALRALSDEIKAAGQSCDFFACDVANSKNVQETVNKILDKYTAPSPKNINEKLILKYKSFIVSCLCKFP